jgi:spore coat protein CotH
VKRKSIISVILSLVLLMGVVGCGSSGKVDGDAGNQIESSSDDNKDITDEAPDNGETETDETSTDNVETETGENTTDNVETETGENTTDNAETESDEKSTDSGEAETTKKPTSSTDKENEVTTSKKEETTTVADSKPDNTVLSDEEKLYEKLFDPNSKISIDIKMSDKELQKLQDDYDHYSSFNSKSPIYRRADMVITIDGVNYQINDVGVRMKGNTSRMSFYDSNSGIYNAIHLKIDFQETFDDEEYYGADAEVWESKELRKARKNRTFATLEKLELRWNKCCDSTYLREGYAYDLYSSFGVLAPKVNLCSLDWSNVHMGVFTVNEPVDEVFIEKRLPEAEWGGDLYKCSMADFRNTHSVGIENEDKGEFYAYDLKSNKKTSQHEALNRLINGLTSGVVTKESFAELVDIDNFLSYAAVSYFAGNPDDLRNNYNNFYLYLMKSSGKAIIIPYDCDRVFGTAIHFDPSNNALTRENPFSEYVNDTGDKQKSPLYLYSIVKGGYYVKEYASRLNEVSKSPLLKPETFKARVELAKSLYGNDVNPSKHLNNLSDQDLRFDAERTASFGSGKNVSFKDYITEKMKYFPKHMEKVEEYAVPQVSSKSGYYIRGTFNDWSVRDDYNMKLDKNYLVYTLDFNNDFAFKIYNEKNDRWMGTECMSPDVTVPYTSSEGHANIELKAGKYIVKLDIENMLIIIERG